MAFELHPLALQNVATLRALRDLPEAGYASFVAFGDAIGRDPSNLRKSLAALAEAGLVAEKPLTSGLTDEGCAQLDAIARAEGGVMGGDLLPDERLVVHAQLRPDPDNPRKDFESDDAQDKLDELRISIVQDGLLQNLVCRTDPEGIAAFIVTAGNRRWHAIQQAIFDDDWPEDRPIRIKVREGDARSSLLTAIVENKQRADMSAIEEAEAFGELVNVHGMKTVEIAGQTGLSQKVVQNRLKLLNLSDDDRERMRLPEDHPDHLGYKAALRQLTVTKEPEPTLGQLVAQHGAATLTPREPGSPDLSPTPAEAPSLGKKLTDAEALILAEVVDKAEREPNDQHPDYTAALPAAMKSGVPHLIGRGLLGTRQLGMTLLIRPLLHTSGLKEWLEDIGFNRDRDGVLFELAARVVGADRVTQSVRYTTPWLNLEGDPRNAVAEPETTPNAPSDDYARLRNVGLQIPTLATPQSDLNQPELIEATEEEKAERQRIEDERACVARSQAAAERLAALATDWMGFARARGARDYLNPCFEGGGVISNEAMALELISAIVDGRTGEAAALLATLNVRAGVIGAQQTLKAMSLFKIQNAVSDARKPEGAAA